MHRLFRPSKINPMTEHPETPTEHPETPQVENLRDRIIDVIRTVYDPEIPVNVYDIGLIYEVTVYPVNNVYIRMTLTSPTCPAAGVLPGEVENKVKTMPGINNVDLELTFDPPWEMSMMSDEAKLELGML